MEAKTSNEVKVKAHHCIKSFINEKMLFIATNLHQVTKAWRKNDI
jgi:hypothetical protein